MTCLQLHKINIFGSCFTILAAAEKAVRRGVKEVVKAVNKESKGYVRSPGIVVFQISNLNSLLLLSLPLN